MRVLIVSDNGVPTGYGRIADEVGVRMHRRGHEVLAMSYYYDGLLPAQLSGKPLPYPVSVLQGKQDVIGEIAKVIGATQPDLVLSIQDFPYHMNLFHDRRIDWSQRARVFITPIDGVPIEPTWLDLLNHVDGALTISAFGQRAFAEAGHRVGLCRPGVDVDDFYPETAQRRAELRAALELPEDAFVLGTMAQNQGRKAITLMLKGFYEFAKDKPHARYLLDMDEVSPAGWNLPNICQQQGWDVSKIIWRWQAQQAGLHELRERYNVLDTHAVLAHREGYGLPLAEAMACGVVSMAMDYCSGTEIVGEGRGCLIRDIGYSVPGTWGGAEDRFPDLEHFAEQLNWLHDNPHERLAMAERGKAWAREQTWDKACDNVIGVLERVMEKRQMWKTAPGPVLVEEQAA